MLDIEARNKHGETAHDITCKYDEGPSESKKERIHEFLSGS